MEYATIFIILGVSLGLLMAFGIGANDVANAIATSVGSKTLTLRQAVIIAAIFEFTGAFFAGGQVTLTIREGIIDANLLSSSPELLVYGMLAALLAASLWLLVATKYGLPVSTTHSIIGAIVGFAAVGIGVEAVKWIKVGSIAASWVISPMIASALAYAFFRSVQVLILNACDPIKQAKRYVPFYIFLTGAMISLVTMLKGLKHIGLDLSKENSYGLSIIIGLLCAIISAYLIRKFAFNKNKNKNTSFHGVEKIFGVLMIFTACAIAFAHGSNDVANAVGPVTAIISIVSSDGGITQTSKISTWVLLLCAIGIVAGLLMYGHKVIATVGTGITTLTPSSGFCCNLAASTTVVLASGAGFPVSTTQTLVGAVLGVGLARGGVAALNLGVIGSIFMSWIITLPINAILAITIFYILSAIFG